MKKYLVITIDVEPDCSSTWIYSNPLSFRGVTVGIKEILQPLFNKYDIKPTYLINNVVLEDHLSIETFKSLEGNFELGTHLHAEFIEPDKKFFNYAGKKGESNQCFLEPEIEFEKIRNITNLFEQNFKQKPTSFRAGRFSAGVNTINSLKVLGYKVDTSVTPHILWQDKTRERAVDYRAAHEQPYYIKENSYLERADKKGFLEVPVSIIKKGWPFNKPLWLRPYYSKFNDYKKIIESFSKSFSFKKEVVFNMMFHNVEVLPGLSPYTSNEKEAKNYLDDLEKFLSYCQVEKIESVGVSELWDKLG